jgi:hypothetical protein
VRLALKVDMQNNGDVLDVILIYALFNVILIKLIIISK